MFVSLPKNGLWPGGMIILNNLVLPLLGIIHNLFMPGGGLVRSIRKQNKRFDPLLGE